MPVRPSPFEIRCPQCGWHEVKAPRSDALTPADIPPQHCPRCKHEHLEVRPASGVTMLGSWLKRLMTSS